MTKIKTYQEKRTGKQTYWFSHYIGINPATGKKVLITKRGFETEEDAIFALAQIKISLRKGKAVGKKTFAEIYEMWIVGYERSVRPISYDRTRQQFEKYILPILGKKKVDSITIIDCQHLVNDWSSYYVNFKVLKSCVQRVLDHACRLELIATNPMRFVIMPRIQVTEEELLGQKAENFYDVPTLKEFIRTLSDNFGLMEVALFRLLSATGIRKGELSGLIWEDVNFEEGTLHIRRSIVYLDGKLHVSEPKTKKSVRKISLDERTLQILLEWKKQQMADFINFGVRIIQPVYVFSQLSKNMTNIPLYPKYPDTIIEKVLNLNPSLPKITCHGFRHTHAAILIESGVGLKAIQERLGHSSMTTTYDTYGHLTKKAKEDVAKRFQEYIQF